MQHLAHIAIGWRRAEAEARAAAPTESAAHPDEIDQQDAPQDRRRDRDRRVAVPGEIGGGEADVQRDDQDAQHHVDAREDDGDDPCPAAAAEQPAGDQKQDDHIDGGVDPGPTAEFGPPERTIGGNDGGQGLDRCQRENRYQGDESLLLNAHASDPERSRHDQNEQDRERVLDVRERTPIQQGHRAAAEQNEPRAGAPRRRQQAGGSRQAGHRAAGGADIQGEGLALRPGPGCEGQEPEGQGAGEDREQLSHRVVREGYSGSAPPLEVPHADEARDRDEVDPRMDDEERSRDRCPPLALQERRQPVGHLREQRIVLERLPQALPDDAHREQCEDENDRGRHP